MTSVGSVFKDTYRQYLERIKGMDLMAVASPLGITVADGVATVPLLGEDFRVSGDAMISAAGNRPGFDVCVIIANYLLRCPETTPLANDWVTYYGLKDAGPLAVFFKQDVERAIAAAFSGATDALQKSGEALGGRLTEMDVACDLAMQFTALPNVPLVLLFNDMDQEFSAASTILFERRAEAYLDPECLAMLGRYLFTQLTARSQ